MTLKGALTAIGVIALLLAAAWWVVLASERVIEVARGGL